MRINQQQRVVILSKGVGADVADQQGHFFADAFGLGVRRQVVTFRCKADAKQGAFFRSIGPDTFGQDHNALLLVDALGSTEMPRASKISLARQLVKEIATRCSRTA